MLFRSEFMPTLKADQVLIDKARATENITLLTNAAVEQVVAANGAVSHLAYRRRDRSEERRVGKECRSRWSPDN